MTPIERLPWIRPLLPPDRPLMAEPLCAGPGDDDDDDDDEVPIGDPPDDDGDGDDDDDDDDDDEEPMQLAFCVAASPRCATSCARCSTKPACAARWTWSACCSAWAARRSRFRVSLSPIGRRGRRIGQPLG